MILYQFPISHYCEKVRWALDYKGVSCQIENLLPGLHLKQVRRLAGKTSVPVLQAGDNTIQGSAQIISWLDQHYPDKPLTPEDPLLAQQALDWETLVDKEIGVHVRRFAYHTLLDYPAVVQPFFLSGGKWWWKPFLKLSYPTLQRVMRQTMKIDALGAEHSRQCIEAALTKVCERLQSRDYLVGDQFSRADLAAAALIAPMIMPPQYGLNWPEKMPSVLQDWADAQADNMAWAQRLYQQHR